MDRKNTKKRGAGLFLSLAAVMGMPILVLGIIFIVLGTQSVSEGMELEIKKALASTARETVALYSLSYPGEIKKEGQHFLMGGVDLSGDYTLIDQIKENTGNEISIFYGDTRMLTTIKDSDGGRFVHTTTEDANIIATIRMGNEYYSNRVEINGQFYYGYYVPLRNGNEICGMVFAGMTNESVKVSVHTIVTKIVIVFLIALMAVFVIASMYASNIVKALNQIGDYIGSLAENNFKTRMPAAILQRSDELGDMGRHAQEVGANLQTLIYRDSLTGLYNRRAGRMELSKYIDLAESSNYRRQVVVALGDIDFFKKINDTYGHECGDMVLTGISEVMEDLVGEQGVPIRWGGEEFLLAFKTDYRTAREIVEHVNESIRDTEFTYEGQSFHVSMTFGISSYRKKESIEQVVKRADEYLYRGKRSGRDRVVGDESV